MPESGAPELVLSDAEGPSESYLVIDRTVNGRSAGGVRLVPDPSHAETAAMARTMTLKRAFVGDGLGGAKAAIRVDPDCDTRERSAILREVGRRWAEPIASRRWRPEVDMGCSAADLNDLLVGAGVPWRTDPNSRHATHLYAAWSVVISVEEAAAAIGMPIRGSSFAVEGFGRVGSIAADLLSRRGALLVAASNRHGTLHAPHGIDVAAVTGARNAQSDDWLRCWDGEGTVSADPSIPLAADVDILIPAARSLSISSQATTDVRAKVIACAANAPYEALAGALLHERGALVVPDFVASCGGIFGSMFDRHASDTWIRKQLEARFRPRLRSLIEESVLTGRSVETIAAKQVSTLLADPSSAVPSGHGGLGSALRSAARRSPRPLRALALKLTSIQRTFPLPTH